MLIAIAVLGWICAAALATWLVSLLGFFGIGLIGVTTWFVGSWIDLEKEGTVGHELTPGLYADQIRAQQGMSRAERAAMRSEQSLTRRKAQFFKYLGMGLTAIGLGGFLIYQL
ncbi:MAG TPA: hypothetical protein VED46_08005 [Alphaproteobacteria bacterium]|nr:hypothetical protein [Alphaproteobacteria bacterium]